MSFEQFLVNTFNNTNLKPLTISRYVSALMRIYNGVNIGGTNEDFFYYTDEIINFVNTLKAANSSKRSYYTNILKLLSNCANFNQSVFNTYKLQYVHYVNLEQADAVDRLDKLALSKDKWCTLQELQSIPFSIVTDICSKYGLTKTGDYFFSGIFVNRNQYMNFKHMDKVRYMFAIHDFIVAYMHMRRVSLRLELQSVAIVAKADATMKNTNYIVDADGKMKLYLNVFKNVKSFNAVVQTFNDEEYNLVKLWLKLHEYNNEYLKTADMYEVKFTKLLRTDLSTKLLYFTSGTVYTAKLKYLTQKYINKDITCTTIRKIWETYFQTDEGYKSLSNAEKEVLHKQMLHTVGVASGKYNVHNPQDVEDKKDNNLLKYIKD
jgi:hypothetical protein